MANDEIRVLLTGPTGFIGSAVHDALRQGGVRVHRLIRSSAPDPAGNVVHGDLTDPRSLRGACDGVDAVVHAASYVGPDPARCEQVNHLGTRHLLAEAARAGVRRVLYVGTAAVYGNGPHRGLTEDERPVAPASPVSASRAAADAAVREHGGCVLRPHLVYGPGDRWVVPALVAMLAALPGWIHDGQARLSMVNVRALARLAFALTVTPAPPGALFHADHPTPVTVRDAAEALARHLGVRIPRGTLSADRLADLSLPSGLTRRHLAMVSDDHWYASAQVWRLTGQDPGPAIPDDLRSAPAWYPDLVAGRAFPATHHQLVAGAQ